MKTQRIFPFHFFFLSKGGIFLNNSKILFFAVANEDDLMYGVSRKPVRFLINPLSFVSSIKERPGRDIEELIWIEGILGGIQEINISPSTSRNTPTLPAHKFCMEWKTHWMAAGGGGGGAVKRLWAMFFLTRKICVWIQCSIFLTSESLPRAEARSQKHTTSCSRWCCRGEGLGSSWSY